MGSSNKRWDKASSSCYSLPAPPLHPTVCPPQCILVCPTRTFFVFLSAVRELRLDWERSSAKAAWRVWTARFLVFNQRLVQNLGEVFIANSPHRGDLKYFFFDNSWIPVKGRVWGFVCNMSACINTWSVSQKGANLEFASTCSTTGSTCSPWAMILRVVLSY